MGGLLYKDFVSVNRIKKVKLTWILTALTVLFIVLRMAFPGTADMKLFLAENEDGEIVNIVDTFFFTAMGLFIVGTLELMNGWTAKLTEADDKNKIRAYISALPLEKNAYIASKYIFMAISSYVFMSISYIWNITCLAFCREGIIADTVQMTGGLIPAFTCIALLITAVELPLFILFGKEKAMLMKAAFLMLIAFAFLGFLLFGDLIWFSEHFDITVLVKWFETYKMETAVAILLSPVPVLALYYGSYRLTCHFAKRTSSF